MRQLFILTAFLFCVQAYCQPAYILNQSYIRQWQYCDSMTLQFRDVNYDNVCHQLNSLETWAKEHGDEALSNKFAIIRVLHERNSGTVIQENKLKEIIAYARENKLTELEADGLQGLGNLYWTSKQKHAPAFENLIAAYKIYSRLSAEQFPSKRVYLYELGSAYYSYGDLENAIKFLEESARNKAMDKEPLYYSIYNSIGLSFRRLKIYDSSEWYFQKVYKDAIKSNDTVWTGIIGGNIGITYFYENRYAEAIPLLEKDIASGLAHHVIQNAAGSIYYLATIYYNQGKYDSAERIAGYALQICEGKPFWPKYQLADQLFTILSKVYAAKNDMRRAYLYADSAITAKDSVSAQFNALNLTKAQEKIDYVQHQLEAEQLETSKLALAKKRNESWFLAASIALMLLVIIGILRTNKKQKATNELLSAEKKKSEDLLLNILPPEVADELKNKGAAHARQFDDVTVLFTDFVGFTMAGEKMSPQQLVGELHSCFKAFDDILGKYDIEKIKTVGDAYLAVSGLPVKNRNHATDVVAAAIEIRDFMKNRQEEHGDRTFEIRIGINSGSVVAGIVGVKKFAYDIWGDTVNTAARMEQNSEAGKINISESTYQLVKDKFRCTYRGKLEVKNKGVADMYYVD